MERHPPPGQDPATHTRVSIWMPRERHAAFKRVLAAERSDMTKDINGYAADRIADHDNAATV